ncbi:hypothetical protein TRV_01172 [Trichophyton verrucosum HKI 0517]|uniref:Uncharacterized protein n=1 Tax=Trichophyton verrucosum (strain HKI 0517) TaxID=663202 RepID=D4D270_TRIVH|nr:uncharacterized protein TRV_01172 [Trichophyton verrucosum HKI 0517]EFE44044.1 hypothetical protein TRV_01172 [Trichophyton verrucosum HKI 0517]
MAEKNEFGAIPLFLQGRDFILQQTVDDHPGKRAAKVDDLVHGKGHDAGGEDVVLHVGVPGRPHLLEDIELGVYVSGGGESSVVEFLQVPKVNKRPARRRTERATYMTDRAQREPEEKPAASGEDSGVSRGMNRQRRLSRWSSLSVSSLLLLLVVEVEVEVEAEKR